MDLRAFLERWRLRQAEFARFGATVSGAAVVGEMLDELREELRSAGNAPLTLEQAAQRSGYSRDHIGRLLRSGRLENVGSRGRPRVRASDLPLKAKSGLQFGTEDEEISPRRRIALSVTNSNERSA